MMSRADRAEIITVAASVTRRTPAITAAGRGNHVLWMQALHHPGFPLMQG